MDLISYLLGLVTIPALIVLAALTFRAWLWLEAFAGRRGYSVDVRLKRDVKSISEWTLRNDLWFERAWGPIFIGHWYREKGDLWSLKLRDSTLFTAKATRWIGFGRSSGPCVTFYKVRDLGIVRDLRE